MGDWYVVIKTIKGRQYRYRQRTWREGGRVRTECHSLGPVTPAERGSGQATPAASIANPVAPSLAAELTKVIDQLSDRSTAAADWIMPFQLGAMEGPIKKIAILEQVITACSVNFRTNRKGKAFYAYGLNTDYVSLPPKSCFSSVNGLDRQYYYYFTFFHELAHWTRHPERTGRVLRTGMVGRDQLKYAREELVAEAAAVLVLTKLGFPPSRMGQHANYFQHWLDQAGDREEALQHAIIEGERAAEFILSRINTTKVEG